MKNIKELTYDELNFNVEAIPNFESTLEISPFKDIIGQDRAIEALDVGLIIKKDKFNIFVCGENGTGKRTYVIKKVREYASKLPSPEDWCYVYNFEDNNKPIAISLKSGTANEFEKDIQNFMDKLFKEVPKSFSNKDYEKSRNDTIDKYQKQIVNVANELYKKSEEYNFEVQSAKEGFVFIPLKNGEQMTEKDYAQMQEDEKDTVTEKVSELKLLALDIIRKSKVIKREMNDILKELDDDVSSLIVEKNINDLKGKYGYNEKIINYLENMREDIIENIDAFLDYEDTDEVVDEDFFKRYYVNVMVSNENVHGAPVIYEGSPEYHNLLGRLEYENKQGTLVTDLAMIQAGSLHRANGGFIIIDAMQLLRSYEGWETLKKSLINKTINLENLKNQFDILPIVSLKPEEIPLDVKVILIGNLEIYYLLYGLDNDFRELFKIKADFEDEFKNTTSNVMKLLGLISNFCNENDITPINKKGFIELLRYASRRCENKNYLTAMLGELQDVIIEASFIALRSNEKYITDTHVKKCIDNIQRRNGLYRDKIIDMYKQKKYLVNIYGYRIGEINGLSVTDLGDFSFGRQQRITVTTYMGGDGIINIEREAKMSGNIHTKGIMILSGYMGEAFGQNNPISFNANICFEQLYGGIDGDSASAAELIALLSSLSDVPISQNIAITGSINQKGEIQPIGGINEKIEGFFDICSIYGLDGTQGVIIPESNIDDLILNDKVINSVKESKFHIYPVKVIDDCLEILCSDSINKVRKKKSIEFIREAVFKKLEKYKNNMNEANKK